MTENNKDLLRQALYQLEKASELIDDVLEKERDNYDSIPENLQNDDDYDYEEMGIILEKINDIATRLEDMEEDLRDVAY